MKPTFEKLGLFYLGKDVNGQTLELTDTLTLLKNKHFTTHAAIIGMTGSGKTGLGVALLEEAALDNIPSIVIDPKGDMGDLCLSDPAFDAKNFLPWVSEEAKAKNEDPLAYAQKTATVWKEGIEAWGQDSKRVARFSAHPKRIYTPGSDAGIPINLLGTLTPPSKEIMEDSELFASTVQSTTFALLSLIKEPADTGSKAYVLIAQILSRSWSKGDHLGIEGLIASIIEPPFQKIGVLGLEAFFNKQERFALASKFNTLLADPAFGMWLKGEALDVEKMLFDQEGRARVNIFTISHLSRSERHFFVTLLLNRVIAWMRRSGGSNTLRALLYMDEIFGFFPPSKNPPPKEPMLTLLKQARAYGLGVVLSTQNPVDLDYKGLSNIGTWFIGRLQTTQDIEKVLEGLSSQKESTLTKEEIKRLLASLKKRTFFLKSAHLDSVKLFQTRFVLSYLKGPLKREEIAQLMRPYKNNEVADKTQERDYGDAGSDVVPIVPHMEQYFEPPIDPAPHYIPFLYTHASILYDHPNKGIYLQRELELWSEPVASMQEIDFALCEQSESPEGFLSSAPKRATFASLPDFVLQLKQKELSRALKSYLYRNYPLTLYRCKRLRLTSEPDESLEAFEERVISLLSEKKEEQIEKLRDKFEKKEVRILKRLEKAKDMVEKEKADVTASLIDTGIAILGALFGRTTVTKIGRVASKGSRAWKNRNDISEAEEKVMMLEEELEALSVEFEEEIEALDAKFRLDNYPIESFEVRAKKSDIVTKECQLIWRLLL